MLCTDKFVITVVIIYNQTERRCYKKIPLGVNMEKKYLVAVFMVLEPRIIVYKSVELLHSCVFSFSLKEKPNIKMYKPTIPTRMSHTHLIHSQTKLDI